MAWTAGAVAQLAKVGIRTLHHYDDIGLLQPSGRSRKGCRLCKLRDLGRMQQILFFKQLG